MIIFGYDATAILGAVIMAALGAYIKVLVDRYARKRDEEAKKREEEQAEERKRTRRYEIKIDTMVEVLLKMTFNGQTERFKHEFIPLYEQRIEDDPILTKK